MQTAITAEAEMWDGSPSAADPDNYWDDETNGGVVCAHCAGRDGSHAEGCSNPNRAFPAMNPQAA